jgi:hypothetical protein
MKTFKLIRFRVWVTVNGIRKSVTWAAETATACRRDITTLCTLDGTTPDDLDVYIIPEVFHRALNKVSGSDSAGGAA